MHVDVNLPIKCNECGEQFSRISNYNRHRPTHEGGLDRFDCLYLHCTLSFTRKFARDKHQFNRRLHPIALPNQEA